MRNRIYKYLLIQIKIMFGTWDVVQSNIALINSIDIIDVYTKHIDVRLHSRVLLHFSARDMSYTHILHTQCV